jgi:hypothetical protein
MRFIRPFIYFLLLILILSISGPLAHAKMKYNGMDRNRDGVITIVEWRGNDQSFQNQDWNGDGVLSGDEVRSGARRDDYYDRNRNDDASFANTAVTNTTFRNLNTNNDAYLTRNEWRAGSQAFLNKDCNSDDRVSRVEYFSENCSSSTCDIECLYRELDLNNDGLIYRTEWRGNAQTFNQLDQNGDNTLNRNELSYINQNKRGKAQQVLGTVSEIINSIF